jgi:cytochrome oxidase Cu insertion factor (SCO1/SenC/PrrC family)
MRSLIRSAPVLLVLLLVLGAGLVVYSQARDRLAHVPADPLGDVTDAGLPVGIQAPEIQGRDIDGKRFKLSDYRGKVVVLDCWVDR